LLDGRLDNRAELLAFLGAEGGLLADAPDGLIALKLFEREGRNFVHRLTGDYAIATWQPRTRRLELFRSPMGWRPLLWAFDGTTFGFATEPRALIVGLEFERKLNEGAIGEFLSARFVTETDTLWAGIERVPQGGAIAFEDGVVSHWAWHGGPFEDFSHRSLDEHVERFNHLLNQSIGAMVRSDRPVTAQLSGGLDSSSLVCRATELFREGKLDRQIGAISARFPGEPHDETEWSSAVEDHLGITAEVVGARRFDPDVARQWCADSYQLPVRPNVLDSMGGALKALQSDGRRVLWTGEGGDDWLNGSLAHWPDRFMAGRWGQLLRHGAEIWPHSPWHVQLRRTLQSTLLPLASPRHRQALLTPHLDFRLDRPDWIRPEWMARIGLEDRWHQKIERTGLRGMDQRSRYSVFSLGRRYTMIDTVLAFAEGHGVEVRHPLHDRRLTDFFMGAGGEHLRKFDTRKHLLREAMKGTLPEKIRQRRTKSYFVSHQVDAIDELLRQKPAHELNAAKLGWIVPEKIAAMHAPFEAWRRNGSQGPIPAKAWGPVWFTLATDMWLEHAFGQTA
jgi:asparagine synthase (glutamine-hydrolysing)